jgi:acyl carrier protein phosphodiesterase
MNYLGHAYLSFSDPEILTGNMIGDHIKGVLTPGRFPERIQLGLITHRHIDTFTDGHPAIQRAKLWFRADYGLYAGAITDTLMDHFLANDAQLFPSEEDLMQFTQDTYQKLAQHSSSFPPAFANYFPHMREHNWLYHYRTLQGIRRSLNGLARRAGDHMPPVDNAWKTFIGHYYQLAQCYYEFIDDVRSFVKLELKQNPQQ